MPDEANPFIRNSGPVFQHGVTLRRLYPNDSVDPVWWGSAVASVGPRSEKLEHSHDEHETYFILSGAGTVRVGEQEAAVSAGDVVYIPPFAPHKITNDHPTRTLEYLATWWGGAAAEMRMRKHLDSSATVHSDAV